MIPKHELLDRFLLDLEKQKLQQFVEDNVMLEAVKKVLLFNITNSGTLIPGEPPEPTRNWALSVFEQMRGGESDEKIGRTIRGMCEGIYFLESGLKDLQGIVGRPKSPKVGEVEINEAR